ncbi:hypothetical protein DOY81_000952 [Sarcophaga bullata]|nr:hypothetical protein DOY81_000952 [Sarcophaga bullata]
MADKKNEQYYAPPPKMGKWQGFKTFLWNSETSQCLGRTGGSWAKILIFYVIFYAALAGFFAAIFAVFYQTLEMSKPKWILEKGLIGTNPGLGFRPMPPEANVESTLVWYESNKPDNFRYWVQETANFLKSYEDLPKQNQVNCSFENPPDKVKDQIYDWIPEIYNDSKKLPEEMPTELKRHITEKSSLRPNETNVVWVSCEGENPADVENIKARDYYPRMGFPVYYFPFKNIAGYIPPIVAVQFTVETGVLINIECKAWARNIHHDRSERRGSVHFELMVD